MSEISGSSPCGGRDRSLQRKPNAVDAHVGERLRLRRRLLGLSQEELAARLGLALQQVQKYETGANRVSASRLYQLGRVLEVPVAWFFEAMPGEVVDAVPPAEAAVKHEEAAARELVRLYTRIGDERLRRKLHEIAKDFAASGGN
jgi:transcriptional regulator with XRE-family HTH domain